MNRTTYGLDIAKSVMQLHWVDGESGEIGRKKLARAKLREYFAQLQPVRVVMEACGSAHHWARVLGALGHQVELLPARQVRPFVRSNKDDAADARAIWLAAQQSDIRRVPQKTADQQAVMALHRTRSHWVSVRTATVNALRGTLYEFGVILPGGKNAGLKALGAQRAEVDAKVPATVQRLIDGQLATLKDIGQRIDELEAEIAVQQKQLPKANTLRQVPGIGLLGATALAATLGDGRGWKSGREFSASLGIVPAHSGTGGKARVGHLTKRGDPYLRTLLIHGARSVDHACQLHDHQANPHVHISVRAESKHGRRLNPRKTDLHRWRETFAENLKERGVEAEATRQATRGNTRNYEALWRIKAREDGRLHTGRPNAKSGQRARSMREEAVEAWQQIGRALGASGEAADRDLARSIGNFVTDLQTSAPIAGPIKEQPEIGPHR